MTEKQESSSNGGDQWVPVLLSEARNSNPSIPDGVWASMELLLKGQMSERELTQANLKAVATQLIGEMVPTSPQPEETQ